MEIMGKSACDASLDWLDASGFPTDADNTLLLLQDLPDNVVNAADPGDATGEWMGAHGTKAFADMIDAVKVHYRIKPTYYYIGGDGGIETFIASGIPPANIHTIGSKDLSRLGYMGTNATTGRELNPGFGDHVRNFVIPSSPIS